MDHRIDLIAPCGIYCGICMKYLERELPESTTKSGPCSGCRQRNKNCAFLKKGCPYVPKNHLQYCFECNEFPCDRLQRLDATYKHDYEHGLIDNLELMKAEGLEAFIERMEAEHRCDACGHLKSVHNRFCYGCGRDALLEYMKSRGTAIRKQARKKRKGDGRPRSK